MTSAPVIGELDNVKPHASKITATCSRWIKDRGFEEGEDLLTTDGITDQFAKFNSLVFTQDLYARDTRTAPFLPGASSTGSILRQ